MNSRFDACQRANAVITGARCVTTHGNATAVWAVLAVAGGLVLATVGASASPPGQANEASNGDKETVAAAVGRLPSVEEARGRARLLNDAIRAMLQVVHHEYYREDEKLPIPARTFKKVFQELADRQKVEVHWLAVDAQAMNQDHNPRNEFEKKAVSAIVSGAAEFELAEGGRYRHVGVITLTSECLKCHVPNRTNTKNRAAGLVIAIPIETK